ncbi:hypothetical protein CTEN210_03409 [Chaetoceros tenuissimus]|uniref:Uncharacterized protein n=1 Tax=Chaetoceros tenuissimus TaxID=426638 RepID=A0AAD3CLM4_9STRA|nr:hypothetical protein CTEN210_03409 [Chaetoceros tenuissimus]
MKLLSLLSFSVLFPGTSAFVLAPKSIFSCNRPLLPSNSNSLHKTQNFSPIEFKNQRKSVANVQTMGLFGLGAPEIAIILIAGAFLLGPQKIAELSREAGKTAGELKEIPKEFQKGIEEGEVDARSKNAKQMDSVDE